MTSPSLDKLLDAAIVRVRHRGFAGASVEDICQAAGVSKGAFFHHFRSKDDLAAAAAQRFNARARAQFSDRLQSLDDPRARLLAYLRLRRDIIVGEPGDFGCYLGTIVQEAHESHAELTAACGAEIFAHAGDIEAMAAAAKARYAPDAAWSPRTLSQFTQCVMQGAFVLAKAGGGPQVARESVDHLIDYVERLLPAETAAAAPAP